MSILRGNRAFTAIFQSLRTQAERRWRLLTAGMQSHAPGRWTALGMALCLGAVYYLGILLVLRATPIRRALRARAVAALAARIPGARLEGTVGVDALFRPVMDTLVLPASGEGGPLLVVDRITVQPRPWRLFTGHLEVGELILNGVHIHGGPKGQRLPELARALRFGQVRAALGGPSHVGPTPPVLVFSGLELRLEDPTATRSPIILGPLSGHLRLNRTGDRTQAFLTALGPGPMEGALEATWGGGPGALRAHLHGLGAETLPEVLRRRLPFAIRDGAIDLSLEAPNLGSFARGEGQLKLATRNLSLFAGRLDPEPVGPLPLRMTGRVRWDTEARTAALEDATVALDEAGRAALKVTLLIGGRPEPHFSVALRVTGMDWTALAASLPPPLAPPPGAPRLAGLLAGSLTVAGPLHEPADWKVEGAVDLSRLAPAPTASAANLARPFVHEARLVGGRSRRVIIGPGNPAFVPLAELPNHLVRAVLESEDAGFYGHQGFDLSEVQEALASEGRLRGASTLTQQLAKNLFLSRERTLSRKVREALATLALEVAVGKRRILEIYLNLVEWGDGVYGIGEAARHWFGKDARALSPKEAVMLATVIPNPVRYDMYRRRGALTPAWEARVADLLAKLHTTGVLDDEALRAAEAETLTFNVGSASDRSPSDKDPETED